jgi:co-chaperonin GroES (HSP10)
MKMATRNNGHLLRIAIVFGMILPVVAFSAPLAAQAPAAPSAAATSSQRGTVKEISGSTITMTTDAGQATEVTVPSGARILQVPVGSTDLKSATPAQVTDIAAGDHVLVTGKAGDTPATMTALRVIVMKSSDIAQKNAAEQADWRARGTGGIVSAIDAATGTITLAEGTKKVTVNTNSKTDFRRFAGDSVKYQDAKPGTLAQIRVKDQLQARGAKSADGSSVQAEEVVSGSFENLSGLITSVDQTDGTITLKDLMTKKMMTVNVTKNADIRKMPLQMAMAFAARSNGGQGGGGRRGGGGGQAGGMGGPAGDAGSARRSAGADLSQMIGRLPTITAADLQKGDAVMIVASEATPGATTVTAITVLTGVDPILTANPNGGMDLSMSLGGGGATE